MATDPLISGRNSWCRDLGGCEGGIRASRLQWRNPDAFIGLATALRWLGDIGSAIGNLELANREFVDAATDIDAATTALSLAELYTDECMGRMAVQL